MCLPPSSDPTWGQLNIFLTFLDFISLNCSVKSRQKLPHRRSRTVLKVIVVSAKSTTMGHTIFEKIFAKTKKICGTVIACPYGAQVESLSKKNCQKSRDTVPLRLFTVELWKLFWSHIFSKHSLMLCPIKGAAMLYGLSKATATCSDLVTRAGKIRSAEPVYSWHALPHTTMLSRQKERRGARGKKFTLQSLKRKKITSPSLEKLSHIHH